MSIRCITLVAAIWLLTAAVPAVASWPELPVPDGTQVASVDRHIIYNGLDMRAETFRSDKSLKEMLAYYRKHWNGRIVVNQLGSYHVIGHKDGDYFITIQVCAAAGGSQGRIGVMNIASVPEHPQLGNGLPIPMGSKIFNDIRYPDDAVPARTVGLLNDLSPRQNASYFRERLLGQGWKPVAGNGHCRGETGHCVLRYTDGDSKLTLVVAKGKGGQSQVVINVQNPRVGP